VVLTLYPCFLHQWFFSRNIINETLVKVAGNINNTKHLMRNITKNHWWRKQGYRVNTTWPGSTHFTLYDIMLFRISHYIESTIDHFMQNTMKLLYMFPINCSTFWCFNNVRIIYLLCNFKIIIWFLTRFKYLQIMRKLESNIINETLVKVAGNINNTKHLMRNITLKSNMQIDHKYMLCDI
jgi:hypothetical protein